MIATAGGPVAVARRGNPGTGARPLLVLHGGGPGCHAEADFRRLLSLLPEREVLLVDLPGYGDTPLRRPPGPRFTGCAETVLDVLDALGHEQCDVLAQSLGGNVALVADARAPGRIRRLVAIGSQPVAAPAGVHVDTALGLRVRSDYYGSGAPTAERLRDTVMALEWRAPDNIPPDLLADRHAASVTHDGLAVGADLALLGEPEDLTGLPEQITADTLLVWGEYDPFGEPAYGDWLAGRLKQGWAVTVSGAAHHPQSEFPEATARLIETHLA